MENQQKPSEKGTLEFELVALDKDSYQSLELDNLVGELQRLLKNAPIEKISGHVSQLKRIFDQKLQVVIEKEKESFIAQGGNEIDFYFQSRTAKDFQELYREYRQKKEAFRVNFERKIQENLTKKQEIIEAIKALLSAEENINNTFNQFKELQAKWRSTGPVPKTENENLWANYHHHVERFYDYLDLNRELRDKDFQHNYEEKLKIVERAEVLTQEADFQKAYAELQQLHRIWKEELGPVGKEHRETLWERFSAATKVMHDKKQEAQKEREAQIALNLTQKKALLEQIKQRSQGLGTNHREIQQQWNELNALKEDFYQSAPIPYALLKPLIAELKKSLGQFSKAKNNFYKDQKKQQQERIAQKKALVENAESLKESEEFETCTPIFKQIQEEWKAVGPIPRKIDDPLWKSFKAACNHYFKRLQGTSQNNSRRNAAHKESSELEKVLFQRSQVSKSVSELKAELRQLENNLEFFNNSSNTNPLVVSVLNQIDEKNTQISELEAQLKGLNVERNRLQREEKEADQNDTATEE